MTESKIPDPAKPKTPRRRFTLEERIENRKREIAIIEEGRRVKVRVSIEKAEELLTLCLADATAAGMELEVKRCTDALNALAGKAEAD